ncbi:hypothetical protein ACYATL_03060 [Actinotignum timonense]|uniref:hypothetical protein n=1 Tax=Actinotignum TaxID=1653174 RepID=UPI00254D424C|nr:hypothetical protein [Actinotignum timonense]MDK6906878.1 hypothetical protein [Actinotignum timonense]MDK8782683.1 hypothetical protein [Actinotignum timonense]MDY5156258.1 hypothetical protein [Actinotignum timonense]
MGPARDVTRTATGTARARVRTRIENISSASLHSSTTAPLRCALRSLLVQASASDQPWLITRSAVCTAMTSAVARASIRAITTVTAVSTAPVRTSTRAITPIASTVPAPCSQA